MIVTIKKKDRGASQKAPKLKPVEDLRREWLNELDKARQADKALLAKWRNNG